MAKYKYIHCDVFKRGVTIFIGDCKSLREWTKKFYNKSNEQDLLNIIDKYCTEDDYFSKGVAARYYGSDSGQFIVHLPTFLFEYNSVEIANLSHELMHATHDMLDFVNVEYISGSSNETFTYLHEYLLKNALIEKGYKGIK